MTGDNVTVQYSAWTGNMVFNTKNVTFVIGNNEVIKGLDLGVIGMHEGETKNLTLEPGLAYGLINESRIYAVPYTFFTENNYDIPVLGTELIINEETGRVIELIDEYVIIDTNHFLAGKELNMTVTVLIINN